MARTSLAPQLAANIISYLREQRYPAGAHLSLQPLANTFRVSRAPVLSALKCLEERGLVEAVANRGYFLTLDAENIDQHGEISQSPDNDDPFYFRMAEDRLSGLLPERISEAELMRHYELPRSRVLKLLHRIADEGWIERLPGNGWAFTRVLASRKSYEDGYVFRAVLEQQAMLLPDFTIDQEGFARVYESQTCLIKGGYKDWSRAEIFRANNDFHEMLVACSGNEFFLDSVRRFNRLRRLIEYRITIDRSRLQKQSLEHLHMIELLKDGRRQEAAAFLYTHIMGASRIKSPNV